MKTFIMVAACLSLLTLTVVPAMALSSYCVQVPGGANLPDKVEATFLFKASVNTGSTARTFQAYKNGSSMCDSPYYSSYLVSPIFGYVYSGGSLGGKLLGRTCAGVDTTATDTFTNCSGSVRLKICAKVANPTLTRDYDYGFCPD